MAFTDVLRRTSLGDYARVTDRRTVEEFIALTVVWIAVSMLEVFALAATVPLLELLSGGTLEDAGIPGELMARFVGDWTRLSQTMFVLYVVVGLLVLRVILSALVRWWMIGVIASGATIAASRMVAAYLDAPLSFHAHRNSAVASRTAVMSINFVFTIGLVALSTIVTEVAALLLITALLVIVSPLAALAAVLYFGTAFWAFSRWFQRRTQTQSKEQEDLMGDSIAQLQQSLGGLKEIRLRHDEPYRVEGFRRIRVQQQRLDRSIVFSVEYGRYYIEGAFLVGFGLIASVQLLTQGQAAFAGLGVMLAAGFRMLPSAGRLLSALSRYRAGTGRLAVVIEELDGMGVERLEPSPSDGDKHRRRPSGAPPARVELREITFSYLGADRPAVDNVSVTVEPGSSLGIVGSSGSGKTTTVDLICGLLTPSSGEVLIDGQDPVVLRDAAPIGYVAQDVFLLDASVRENIVFSEAPIDEPRLQHAVHLAQLDPWIASLPDGLDTEVGERGALVSGGQRQRIGIARALYTEPVLLIMDEATSALDVETEAALTSAIAQLERAVTLVVIAHRLSTVRGCDQILVLSDGEAVGLGSYDNLATEHAMFARWASLATGSDQPDTNGHVGDGERVADAL